MRRPLMLAGLLLAVATPAAAQGTAVITLDGAIPDSLRTGPAAALPPTFDMRFTVAFDGKQVGVQMEPGEQMQASLGEQMAGFRVVALWRVGIDSLHLGILLPPELTAMMGGGAGYRMDMALPSTPDSAFDGSDTTMTWTDLERTAVVAGVTCHEWRGVAKADTVDFCVAPVTDAGLQQALGNVRDLGPFKALVGGAKAATKNGRVGPDGGFPIRMISRGANAIRMELQQWVPGTPDASLFKMPDGLEPFPMEMLQGITGTAPKET
jgi:hypothetical protein